MSENPVDEYLKLVKGTKIEPLLDMEQVQNFRDYVKVPVPESLSADLVFHYGATETLEKLIATAPPRLVMSYESEIKDFDLTKELELIELKESGKIIDYRIIPKGESFIISISCYAEIE